MPVVQTNDIPTHYEEAGRGHPLILLHAACLDHHSWRNQVPALQKHFRVIAYDLRGHGQTPAGSRRTYSVETLASDLDALIDGLELSRAYLCGLSMGGMVALTYAARHPSKVAALVVAGTPTPPLLSFAERMQRVVMPRSTGPVARLFGYKQLRTLIIRMQERAHGKAAMGKFQASDLPPMVTRDFIKAIRCMAKFHKTDVDLAKVKVPTLVLYGENEPPFIRRHAERIRAQVPQAQLRAIPNAGHASSIDQPELFTAAVEDFMS